MNKMEGFTLIELMVVMAIIAVLSAILIPQVANFTARARDSRRVSDMKALSQGIQQYLMENGVVPDNEGNGERVGDDSGEFESDLEPTLGEVVPADPLFSDNPGTYYYAWDAYHCSNQGFGYGPNSAGCLGFYTAETDTIELKRETTCGGDEGLNRADYSDIITW